MASSAPRNAEGWVDWAIVSAPAGASDALEALRGALARREALTAPLEVLLAESSVPWQFQACALGVVMCQVRDGCEVVRSEPALLRSVLELDPVFELTFGVPPRTPPGSALLPESAQASLMTMGVELVGRLLGHSEARVREVVCLAVFYISRSCSPEALRSLRSTLAMAIRSSLSGSPAALAKAGVMHESAGWGALEPGLKALKMLVLGGGLDALVEGGRIVEEFVSSGVLAPCAHHGNRFVRESAAQVCSACILAGGTSVLEGTDIISATLHCLEDNWSQVRLAAAGTTRLLFLAGRATHASEDARDAPTHVSEDDSEWAGDAAKYASMFLPRMCLNRFYVADGVRLHALSTWMMLLAHPPGAGMRAVNRHLDDMVVYYVSQSHSENHNLRVTACQALGELGEKVPLAGLEARLVPSLETLMGCAVDRRWHVRAAAVASVAQWVRGPSSEAAVGFLLDYSPSTVQVLWELTCSNAWHVREEAARSLVTLCQAGPPALWEDVSKRIAAAVRGCSRASLLEAIAADKATHHEEPPDLDYDSDGGRDDDLVTEATHPVRHRWSSNAKAAAPPSSFPDASLSSQDASSPPNDASLPSHDVLSPPSDVPLPSVLEEEVTVISSACGAALVTGYGASHWKAQAVEHGIELADLARRASLVGEPAGELVTALLRAARTLTDGLGKAGGAKDLAAPLVEACLPALGLETSSPASANAAQSLVLSLRRLLGAAAFDARMDERTMRVLRERGLLGDPSRPIPSMHPSASSAVRVRVAESGSLPQHHSSH
jgi:hypothetical protein